MLRIVFVLTALLSLASCLTPYRPGANYRALLRPFSNDSASQNLAAQQFSVPPLLGSVTAPTVSGTTAQRVEALLAWLGGKIMTDGSMKALSPFTPENIWKEAREGRGLNCRAAATLFASLLETSGIPARILSLYAKDLSDENHVVVLAWDGVTRRWLYADPSYRTLLYGTDAEVLDLEGVWKSVYEDRNWTYSPGANWNGAEFDLDYRHYLSKNLYRMTVPARDGSSIQLQPEGWPVFGPPWGPSVVIHDFRSFLAAP